MGVVATAPGDGRGVVFSGHGRDLETIGIATLIEPAGHACAADLQRRGGAGVAGQVARKGREHVVAHIAAIEGAGRKVVGSGRGGRELDEGIVVMRIGEATDPGIVDGGLAYIVVECQQCARGIVDAERGVEWDIRICCARSEVEGVGHSCFELYGDPVAVAKLLEAAGIAPSDINPCSRGCVVGDVAGWAVHVCCHWP